MDIPDGATLSLQLASYHRALGEFVSAFSEVEAAVFELLIEYSGLSDEAAAAAFSGVRIDAAMSLIKRLAVVNAASDETVKRIDGTFAQLGIINKVRNDILHYGEAGVRSFVVDRNRITYTPQGRIKYEISLDDFRRLSRDLVKIQAAVLLLAHGARMFDELKQTIATIVAGPWRYKQPQPTALRRIRRHRFEALARLRQSSQE